MYGPNVESLTETDTGREVAADIPAALVKITPDKCILADSDGS